ncbi:DUF3696 domain-containing protein [Mycolicibacterium sp. OfavD-34-C]|uniref:AAA family ATPase n=1 Tax=Mycolicibacterium sp. OfavD-34-C TaxID=2917746 RepID=UPI001EF551EC|nr:AAA family ATPase [Mycolicibacterium sp. OfavD-34-C]MCG7581423.1 AAA family ATPase [Mycolicibacterium sp. OfavD-34-C]
MSQPSDDAEFANYGWQSVRVRNLRGFRDSGEIWYAPVTLLFGKNSSGKTTLLRAPLLLKQAMYGPNSNEAMLSGPEVDFGSYKETVLNGQVSKDVQLTAVLATGGAAHLPSLVREVNPAYLDLFNRMQIDLVIHWNQRSGHSQYQSIAFSNPDTRRKVLSFDRTGPEEFEVKAGSRRLVRVPFPLSLQSLRYTEIALRDKGDDRETVAISFLMYTLSMSLQNTTQDMIHIGPLREKPKRAYNTDQPVVAQSGGSVVAVLRSGQGVKQIAQALQMLGMANSVSVRKLAPGFVAVTLQDTRSGRFDNLADVGFGVSQVLPILATLATASSFNTILIEQPELHLHPEAQGRLADVMYSFAKARRLKLVVESHSEHILLRLQRRVAERVIEPDDVAVYFVDSGRVKRAGIDRYGKLDNSAIPNGFFDDDWEDLMLMTKAAAEAVDRGD